MNRGLAICSVVKRGMDPFLSHQRFKSTVSSKVSSHFSNVPSTQNLSNQEKPEAIGQKQLVGTLKDNLNEMLAIHRQIDDFRSKFARHNSKNK